MHKLKLAEKFINKI